MDELTAFNNIKALILKEKFLDVTQYKENYLKRRLAVRMRALNAHTYTDYLAVMEKNKNELNILLDKLTINVTQFFRDPEVFVELENVILPELLAGGKTDLRVWSAGCSSGEEPYSIAISIEETAERLGLKNLRYEIYATDLDDEILRRALEGKYEGRTLDNIAESRKRKYFDFDGKKYSVTQRIRKNILFFKHNLMEPYKKDFFNLVFCRNVIIYFTRELQKTVLQHYYDSMKEGAVLYLGKTETMLMEHRNNFECINIKERIFRKI